jgi:hypothetical protein
VVEWAWERFDEDTASWCFQRLSADGDNWLTRRHDHWRSSGQPWESYFQQWANGEGLHRGDALVRVLDERFERRHLSYGPYCFPDLAETTAAEEQAAIDSNRIRATRIDWSGRPRSHQST